MIVVTGSAGFIGSALVWELNRRQIDDVLIVDELGSDQRWKNLVNLRYRDILHKDHFISALERGTLDYTVDGILHMGACSSTTETNLDFLLENNYRYTLRLARWCLEHEKRFVYASSAATYGDGSLGFDDDHPSLPRFKPLNGYGFSKYLFDVCALQHDWLNKIAGLKFFNVFGPNEYHKQDMRSVVVKAFEQIQATGKVRLFKSHRPDFEHGGQSRDFVYVKDVVDMTLFLYDNPQANGIFNIGTGKARSFHDLVAAVFAALDQPEPNIEYIDMPENIREKYQYFTQAQMAKLRLSYDKPRHTLEQAVADYVQNYLMTPDPYLNP